MARRLCHLLATCLDFRHLVLSSQKRQVGRMLFLSMQREVEEFLEFDVFPRYQVQAREVIMSLPPNMNFWVSCSKTGRSDTLPIHRIVSE